MHIQLNVTKTVKANWSRHYSANVSHMTCRHIDDSIEFLWVVGSMQVVSQRVENTVDRDRSPDPKARHDNFSDWSIRVAHQSIIRDENSSQTSYPSHFDWPINHAHNLWKVKRIPHPQASTLPCRISKFRSKCSERFWKLTRGRMLRRLACLHSFLQNPVLAQEEYMVIAFCVSHTHWPQSDGWVTHPAIQRRCVQFVGLQDSTRIYWKEALLDCLWHKRAGKKTLPEWDRITWTRTLLLAHHH